MYDLLQELAIEKGSKNGNQVQNEMTATQFIDIWNHFDSDGNGYIEDEELDEFLLEYIGVVIPDLKPQVNGTDLMTIKQHFLETFDENGDGKIDIKELGQLLPVEENFLMLFRFDNPLDSSVEFMRIWNCYDKDGSGFLEANELKNFLRDLLKIARKIHEVSEDQLIEYTDVMLRIFDENGDGKLQLSEMSRLIPVKENFLKRQIFKGNNSVTREDIKHVFKLYDADGNGFIDNEEIDGFLKDLLELVKEEYDCEDMKEFHATIMHGCDYQGKISLEELTMVLISLSNM